MFKIKKILKLGIKAAFLASKYFPQTLLVSLMSEVLILSSKALIKYVEKKGSTKTIKALEKLGDVIIPIAETLANHNKHQFTKSLVNEIKKKTRVKSRDQLIIEYNNNSDFLG